MYKRQELDLINNNQISSFGIPIIVLRVDATKDISLYENRITSIIELLSMSIDDCTSEIEKVVAEYEAENLWPRDSSCSPPLRSKRISESCFRIVKTQK